MLLESESDVFSNDNKQARPAEELDHLTVTLHTPIKRRLRAGKPNFDTFVALTEMIRSFWI